MSPKPSPRYARSTKVEVERTQGQIKKLLDSYGATASGLVENAQVAQIVFEIADRRVRMAIPKPTLDDEAIRMVNTGIRGKQERTPTQAMQALNGELRRLWRAVLMIVRAKLEAVAGGVSTIEDEFLPHIVMPDGRTVKEHAAPWIEDAYKSGTVRPLIGVRPARGIARTDVEPNGEG